jgi:molecular chaperone HtpG
LSESEQNEVKDIFTKVNESKSATVMLASLSPDDQPVTITRPEFMRRMKEMQMLQGMSMGDFGDFYNVVINTNNPLIVNKLLKAEGEARDTMAKYLTDLALLNQGMLEGADLTAFVQKSLTMI